MTNIQFYPSSINAGDCISNAWNMVKQDYWLYFGITIVSILMVACIPCANFFIAGPIAVGVYYVFLRAMSGEQVEFGMMFKGFERFVPAMIVGLVQSLPGIIWTIIDYSVNITRFLALRGDRGMGDFYQSREAVFAGLSGLYLAFALLFMVVSVLWGITFFFAIPLLAEHDLTPVEALKLSAKAAWSNVGGLVVLIILYIPIVLLSILALCVGIFFVVPILYAANAFAYRQVFPLIHQQFNTTPPPPTAYGGSYGQQQ
jgi:uncharacterized membrane protein